jgi:hypothetical protein
MPSGCGLCRVFMPSKQLAGSLIDEPEAVRQADKLVNAFNRRLQEGLKRAATNNPELRGLTERLFTQLQMPVRGQSTLTNAQRDLIQKTSAAAEALDRQQARRPKLTEEEKAAQAAERAEARNQLKAERAAEVLPGYNTSVRRLFVLLAL